MQKKYVLIIDSIVNFFSICDTNSDILFSLEPNVFTEQNISFQEGDKVFLYFKDTKNITTLFSVTKIKSEKIYFKKEYEISNNVILTKNKVFEIKLSQAIESNKKIFDIDNNLFNEINNKILNLSSSKDTTPKFDYTIEIPVVDSSFGTDIEDSELIKILGNELKKSREQAEKEQENISTALHVFAIQFAPVIKERKLSCRDIVEVAGVTESQQVEITKGINIYNKFASIYPLKKNVEKTNLYHFKENTTQENFILDKFKDNPIYKRYIISLLAKPFVILAGISGSGKTKIATDFAKWLKKSSNEDSKITNSLLVSVGSDWTDNTKILGYYNSIKEEYFKTEIIELIERANANENIPFFLILDEMNLSRVERYFSDFLSKMEENSDEIFFNLENYVDENGNEGKLKFPKNLFIIGTVNIDETTYMFSPKVLDRANVIEFSPNDIIDNFKTDLSKEEINPAPDGTAESFLKLALKIRNTTELSDKLKDKENAKKILEDIHNIFNENGKEFGFAYRTIKEIRHYINAAFELNEASNINNVIDEQVLQKILPKIHGNRKQLETLLKGLKQICDNEKYNLAESSKKIESMQKKLETNQFTSFI